MRAHWVGFMVIATGCMATPGVHPTLHPSAPGTGSVGGVAIGAMVQNNDDGTQANIGYGEGFVRLGPGGNFELRTTPQGTFASYDLTVREGSTHVSVRPSFGMAVLRLSQASTGSTMSSDAATEAVVHPGLSVVVQSGSFYAAPRLGVGHSIVLEGKGTDGTAYSLGATVGVRVMSGITAEVSGFYSRETDDTPNPAWTVVPSIGVTVP